MQVVKLRYPWPKSVIPQGKVVLAMGFFDGVHRGHQAVIEKAAQLAQAKKLPLAVLTYDKLPAMVFKQFPHGVHYLTTNDRKMQLFAQLGVDRVYQVDFTSQFANLGPQDFVDQVLMNFHPTAVVAGFDHTYGKPDLANMAKLPDYARDRFDVVVVPKLHANGAGKVSSTSIRQLIDAGDIEAANSQLGYHYQTDGVVVHGFARGRTLGFPTANVDWDPLGRVPEIGVYAVQFKVGHRWYGGMASIGHNKTFSDHAPKTIEVYLFDFNQSIYGEHVSVRWIKRIRGQVKFAGKEALIDQLKDDQIACQKALDHMTPLAGQIVE